MIATRKTLDIVDVDGRKRYINYVDIGENRSLPPIVLLVGTAQTVTTFSQHFDAFSRNRRLLILEQRGQGATTLLSDYCTIPQYCLDILQVFHLLNISKVDFIGFSFGGRVALSFAAKYPNFVSKLSLTGVPYKRHNLGVQIIRSWQVALASESGLQNAAWSFLLNGFSESYINKNCHRLPLLVDGIVQSNDRINLQQLIMMSHIDDSSDPFSIEQCAPLICCPTQIIGGQYDRIAGFKSIEELSKHISSSVLVELKSGHLVPFEDASVWRNIVLKFLNNQTD
jgi:pimeloyl-ACP methyl ester carboxylesterase